MMEQPDKAPNCAEALIASRLIGGTSIAICFGDPTTMADLSDRRKTGSSITPVTIGGKPFDLTVPYESKSGDARTKTPATKSHRYWVLPCDARCAMYSVGHMLLGDLMNSWTRFGAPRESGAGKSGGKSGGSVSPTDHIMLPVLIQSVMPPQSDPDSGDSTEPLTAALTASPANS